MKKLLRYDKGEVRSAYINEEGFLVADVIVTRTGVFNYRNQDGSMRRELRHPDEILKQVSLQTMKMLPITLLHPPEKKVDAGNSKRLSIGFTSNDVIVDGKFVRTKIKITDASAIDAIIGGIQELSLGYEVELEPEVGTYDNENYDYRQLNCDYNHLSVVPAARAGSEARIKMDAEDAIQCVSCENKDGCNGSKDGVCTCNDSKDIFKDLKIDKKTDSKKNHSIKTDKENRMKKITLDGIEYEASPEVINFLSKETARADAAEGKLSTSTEDNSKLQAKLDEANEKLKKAEERNDAEEIQKAVQERLDLVALATPHLDEETIKKINTFSDRDIKVAVINKHYPEAKMDKKDDVYIDARFDGAIELDPKKEENNDAEQRKNLNGDSSSQSSENEPDQEKSRNDMRDNLTNAWKKKSE